MATDVVSSVVARDTTTAAAAPGVTARSIVVRGLLGLVAEGLRSTAAKRLEGAGAGRCAVSIVTEANGLSTTTASISTVATGITTEGTGVGAIATSIFRDMGLLAPGLGVAFLLTVLAGDAGVCNTSSVCSQKRG